MLVYRMEKTKEAKKKEILDYLNDKLKKDDCDITKLTEEEVSDKFSNEQYSKKDIKNIIEELSQENAILSKGISLNIVLPLGKKNILDEKYKNYFFKGQEIFVGLGLMSSVILINIFPSSCIGPFPFSNYNLGVHMLGLIYFFISIIFFFKLHDYLSKKLPFLAKYDLRIFITMFLLGGFTTLIILLIKFFLIPNLEIKVEHIIGIISLSIIGGYCVHNYFFKKKSAHISGDVITQK